MKNLSEKQKQVYDILLMPITSSKKAKTITLQNGEILSGQSYISSYEDPDMSDFAVGFYEILYRDVLSDRLLGEDHFFQDINFAGDTMNSFQNIANITPDAGGFMSERTPYDVWPEYLQQYFWQYRCLANFWLIPMKLGRQSMKMNGYDAMELFLGILKEEYVDRLSMYATYFERFPNFDTFCEKHFVEQKRNKDEILLLYQDKAGKHGEELIFYATQDIKERAYKIATSCFVDELWDYFENLGVIG